MIRFHKTVEPLFFAAERNTMKVTPEILKALNRAKDYYGNTTQLAKHLGIAHSTILFWFSREDKKYQRTALVQASERGIGSFHGGFRRKKKRAGAERGLLCSLHSIHAV